MSIHPSSRRPPGPPPGWDYTNQTHHSYQGHSGEPPYPVYNSELNQQARKYAFPRISVPAATPIAHDNSFPTRVHFRSQRNPQEYVQEAHVPSQLTYSSYGDPYHQEADYYKGLSRTQSHPHESRSKRDIHPSKRVSSHHYHKTPSKVTHLHPSDNGRHIDYRPQATPQIYLQPPATIENHQHRRPLQPPHSAMASKVSHHRQTQPPYEKPIHPPSYRLNFSHDPKLSYQYSNCTGRRKAVLIGINYIGTKYRLKGCINDVRNMARFLNKNYGYQYENMVILTDDQQQPARMPTRANIIRAMQWLVRDAHPNDSLFLHYSGHGGRTKDLDGDEASGFDDIIYPLDFKTSGFILDDDMHAIMVHPLVAGVRLTVLFDSCHSGTALDLPFVYSTKGAIKEPSVAKDATSGVLKNYKTGNVTGAFKTLEGLFSAAKSQTYNRKDVINRKFSPADIISISGCKDSQTSADANENGIATGAMSWSFISILHKNPEQTYLSLLKNMRAKLAPKYTQKPQMSSSHPIDMNLKFLL